MGPRIHRDPRIHLLFDLHSGASSFEALPVAVAGRANPDADALSAAGWWARQHATSIKESEHDPCMYEVIPRWSAPVLRGCSATSCHTFSTPSPHDIWKVQFLASRSHSRKQTEAEWEGSDALGTTSPNLHADAYCWSRIVMEGSSRWNRDVGHTSSETKNDFLIKSHSSSFDPKKEKKEVAIEYFYYLPKHVFCCQDCWIYLFHRVQSTTKLIVAF